METFTEFFHWFISAATGIASAWAINSSSYSRKRNVELENRVTKMEVSHVSEEKITKMINQSTDRIMDKLETQNTQTQHINQSVSDLQKIVVDLQVLIAKINPNKN